MSEVTLTPEERCAMAHCVGMSHDTPHSGRNYYAADKGEWPMWDGLVERGLAKLLGPPAPGFPDAFYSLTPAGYAALKAEVAA